MTYILSFAGSVVLILFAAGADGRHAPSFLTIGSMALCIFGLRSFFKQTAISRVRQGIILLGVGGAIGLIAYAVLAENRFRQGSIDSFLILGAAFILLWGLRYLVWGSVQRDHQLAVPPKRTTPKPVAVRRTSASKTVKNPAQAFLEGKPTPPPPPETPEQRTARINAFFADSTNEVRFEVADLFAELGVTREQLRHYAAQQAGETSTLMDGVMNATGSAQNILRQAVGDFTTATAQNAIINEMPNFTVKRSLFRMDKKQREIYRLITLISSYGAIEQKFADAISRAMIYGGGSATIQTKGEVTNYTAAAMNAVMAALDDALYAPDAAIDEAMVVFNQVKKQNAAAIEKAAEQTQPTPEQVQAVKDILDDI